MARAQEERETSRVKGSGTNSKRASMVLPGALALDLASVNASNGDSVRSEKICSSI